MQKSLIACALTLIWLISGQVGSQALKKSSLRIGVILPLTGDIAMYANAFREGIELAQAEINSSGGVNGSPIEIILEDDRASTTLSHTATQKFLAVDRISAAIVSSYPDAVVGAPEYERAKVPVVVLWDASPEIDNLGEYVFSIGPWIPSAGQVAAQFARQKLGLGRAAIININSAWSIGVSKYFREEFERLGGAVVSQSELNPENTDFRSVLVKVKSLGPDFLYSPLDYNLVPFYRQVRQVGFAGQVLTSDIIAKEHISQDPAAFEGIYQTSIEDPASDEYKTLAKTYRDVFAKEINLPWFVATGYDGLRMLALALDRGHSDPERAKDEMYRIQGYRGACREYSFSSSGSAGQREKMYQIMGGRFISVSMDKEISAGRAIYGFPNDLNGSLGR